MKTLSLVLSLCLAATVSHSQNTVGLIDYDSEKAFDGYNLCYPHNQNNIYLLNNCGQVAHSWENAEYKPGNTAFIQENGDIIRCGSRGPASNPWLHAGGGGEMVERLDWDGNLLWRYFYSDSNHRMHHDMTVLPNGNVALIAWELKSAQESIEAGRDTNIITEGELWPEHIVEIKPIGMDSGEIVWSWHAWDHLIQDYDSAKSNYGIVKDHPELIDLNYDNNNGKADWLHINSIDYNEDLDQIMLSVPFFNEIWIIDHSTTAAEAAGHTGGNANAGGDLLYRWGNPAAYDQGTIEDQKLFFQHDAHWLDFELDPNSSDYGSIGVFNNRVDDSYSSVNTFTASFNTEEQKYTKSGDTFEPLDFDWTYVRPDTNSMFTTGLGGMQRLRNGNTLICAGLNGSSFEIDSGHNIVWEYENPFNAGIASTQGDTIEKAKNLLFRMYRYSQDFPAFTGRNLASKGYIELNPDTNVCDSLTWIADIDNSDYEFNLHPNPTSGIAYLSFNDSKQSQEIKFTLYNNVGQIVINGSVSPQSSYIDLSAFSNGMYFLRLSNDSKTMKILLQD